MWLPLTEASWYAGKADAQERGNTLREVSTRRQAAQVRSMLTLSAKRSREKTCKTETRKPLRRDQVCHCLMTTPHSTNFAPVGTRLLAIERTRNFLCVKKAGHRSPRSQRPREDQSTEASTQPSVEPARVQSASISLSFLRIGESQLSAPLSPNVPGSSCGTAARVASRSRQSG